MSQGITILYDGQCPFCTQYVALLRLREAVGQVALVDARSDDPRVLAALDAGHDLDQGMVVLWADRMFHGDAAVHLLATLSAPSHGLNRLQRWLFATPGRAARIYPVLARGRHAVLWLMRRQTIAQDRKKRATGE